MKLPQNKLLRDNFILFFGSMFAAGLNYLFYPLIGRFLEPAQFGEVQVLMALAAQATLVFGLAKIILIGGVVNSKDDHEAARLLKFVEKILLEISIIVCVLALLAAPLLAHKFKFGSVVPLLIIIPTILATGLRTSRDGYARAKGHFGYSSVQEIAGALIKVILGTLLVSLGLGTIGAILGVTVATFIATSILVYLTIRLGARVDLSDLFKFKELRSLAQKGVMNKDRATTVAVAGTGLVLAVLSSIDTIFSKLSLTPEQAGLYSGISIVANTVFFVSGSVSGVLLASIKIANSFHHNLKMFVYSCSLTLLLSASVASVWASRPKSIVTLLLGQRYVEYAGLLPKVAFAMMFMALTGLIITYHIALRHKRIIGVGGLVLAVIVGSLASGNNLPAALYYLPRYKWGQ